MARDDLADIAVACNSVILPVDCREGMRLCLASQSVHTVVTSPPYFGLRNYDHPGQIGLEQTPDEYVAALVDVFREVRRVLRDDGTVWLNLGDSYSQSGGTGAQGKTGQRASRTHTADGRLRVKNPPGIGAKQLIGIPWRVAFALQADGWYLRQEIIWSKPNPMPESVRDRCTKSHEQIFLLSKSPRYYFDGDAIAEPVADSSKARVAQNGGHPINNADRGRHSTQSPQTLDMDRMVRADGKRNKRSVWTVTTKPYKGAHFATFPPDLIEPCILAGSSLQCCGACGAPWRRLVDRTAMVIDRSERTHALGRSRSSGTMVSPATSVTIGWQPSCTCAAPPVPAVVLDPFGGAGTTALVAQRLGRSSVSFELNAGYVAMAEARLVAG